MPKKLSTPIFGKNYFSKYVLPSEIFICKREIASIEGHFEQHDDQMEILLVTRGRGKIKVNIGTYEICRGSMIFLNPYHFHMVVADKDSEEPFEVTEIRVSAGTQLYITSCPYYHDHIDIKPAPIQTKLDEEMTLQIEKLTENMISEQEFGAYFRFYDLMRIIGLSLRAININ